MQQALSPVKGNVEIQGSFELRINRPELAARAQELVAGFNPEALTLQDIFRIGRTEEMDRAKKLDEILALYNEENSPYVYNAFTALQKGIKEANLDDIEMRIQTVKKPGFIGSLFGSFEKRAGKFVQDFGSLLNGKRKTLLELVDRMEREAEKESEILLMTLKQLDAVAAGLLANVDGIALQVLYIDGVLEKTRVYAERLQAEAAVGDDVPRKYVAEQCEYLLLQLENRRLQLMTVYEKTPTDLQTVAITKSTAGNSFVEIASTLTQQLNGIKSALIQWAMLGTIESSQLADEARRKIAESLLKHGVVVLDRLAVAAAGMPYERRLADAELLVSIRTGIAVIQDKVLKIHEVGRKQFKEAEMLLTESRKLLLEGPQN